jgi:hypothetical protein
MTSKEWCEEDETSLGLRMVLDHAAHLGAKSSDCCMIKTQRILLIGRVAGPHEPSAGVSAQRRPNLLPSCLSRSWRVVAEFEHRTVVLANRLLEREFVVAQADLNAHPGIEDILHEVADDAGAWRPVPPKV